LANPAAYTYGNFGYGLPAAPVVPSYSFKKKIKYEVETPEQAPPPQQQQPPAQQLPPQQQAQTLLVQDPPQQDTHYIVQSTEKKESNLIKILMGVIAVLAVICLVAMFSRSKSDSNSAQSTED
jgi:hypothetical protein